MSHTRRSPRGFSLTEILMAIGILGIGLTMVATIFPVAVDQTRRATDSTMSALCARSIAAMIRANRGKFVDAHRIYFNQLFADAARVNDCERPAEFGIEPDGSGNSPVGNPGLVYKTDSTGNSKTATENIISKDVRVYNPNMFLYEAGRRYVTDLPATAPFWPQWNAGNYVPVFYVTPIVPVASRSIGAGTGIYNNTGGPWRVTIVVFKSRGTERMHPRAKSWYENAKPLAADLWYGAPTWAAGAGDYVIDRGRHAGEAYLIEQVHTDPLKSISGLTGSLANPPIFLACGLTASGTKQAYSTVNVAGNQIWHPLPGAVGVYHTIIGD
ncbi:MAG: prepilin-type N-terminal cleavage/methylation domain-containing protein [Planctomycetota bacterium]|nr:prepilin-type N-terminal cleavage/methylation domain-containing protein [Planctomycetota bacterium]